MNMMIYCEENTQKLCVDDEDLALDVWVRLDVIELEIITSEKDLR